MADLVRRTTLVVRDAEAAADWYGHVFGLRRWMDTPFTLSGRQLAAGAAGDRTRLVIMAGAHDRLGMIGLLQWVEGQGPSPPPVPPTRIAFGAPIFVIEAEDCAATVARARARGGRIHAEPERWEVTGADGARMAMLGASLWDLDGYFFEVNERLGPAASLADGPGA